METLSGRYGPLRATIPESSAVTLVLAAGSRDPGSFPDPDRFDPDRTNNQHLGYGGGSVLRRLGGHSNARALGADSSGLSRAEWARGSGRGFGLDTEAVAALQVEEGTKLSERSGTFADDPYSSRHPTSHERLTGLPWDASYHDGHAPWDIGQPQPAIVRLASEGGFAGAVLDAGCGTGENALHVASLGLSVLGVEVAETALAIGRAKADDRGIEVEFAAVDAFQLERLGRRFETVLDCGLFHTFDGDERPGYVASLASVTDHDGTLYLVCFSDD